MREENFPEDEAIAKWDRDYADTTIKRVEQNGETKLAVMGHLRYVFEQGAAKSSSLVTQETAADDNDAARLSKKARKQYSSSDQVFTGAGGTYFQEGASSKAAANEGGAMDLDLFGMGNDTGVELDNLLGGTGGVSMKGGAQHAAASSSAASAHSEQGDLVAFSSGVGAKGMDKQRGGSPLRAGGCLWSGGSTFWGIESSCAQGPTAFGIIPPRWGCRHGQSRLRRRRV